MDINILELNNLNKLIVKEEIDDKKNIKRCWRMISFLVEYTHWNEQGVEH